MMIIGILITKTSKQNQGHVVRLLEIRHIKSFKMFKHDVITKYNLPKDVKFCVECVMSNQRPRITFDDNGVCSASGLRFLTNFLSL